MSTRHHRPSRAAVFTSLALAAIVAGLAAQDNEAFRRGMQARDDQEWPVVAQRMRDAIAQRPQESTERIGARLGFGGDEYLPHYFLGEALFRSGDCAGAVNAWAISERQGVVQKVRNGEFGKSLRTGYAECEKKGVLPPAKLDPALNALSQQLTDINAVASNVLGLVKQSEDVWRSEANLQGQYERGRAEIDIARKAYEAARNTRMQRDLEEAAAAIARARPIFVTVEVNFNAAIASRQSAQGLMRDVGEAIALAEALNTAIDSKKVPFTPAMTSTHQGGRESLGRARERLSEGQKTLNPQTLSLARSAATEAQTRFRQVLEEIARVEKDSAQRQVSESLTRTLEAFSLLDTAAATLDRFLSERPGVLPADKEAERKAAQDQVARARRRLDQARRSDNVATIADAAKLANEARDRLTLLLGTFGPVTLRDRGVHEALEQGARHYFNAEYRQAAASLAAGEALEADVALRLHFHLLRAAALYELFLRSANNDPSLHTQASAEVQHSKSIDSAFQPDPRAFSPRFLAFYQSVNAPPAAPVAPPAAPPAAPAVPQP
jgi:hypothetical protein